MTFQRRYVQRLTGGELLIHGDAVHLLAELVTVAMRANPRLWDIDSEPSRRRVGLVRELIYHSTTSAPTSDIGSAEVVPDGLPATSTHDETVSAQEAARMLQITTRQVTSLCGTGALDGQQDAPGRPWRIDLHSIQNYQQRENVA